MAPKSQPKPRPSRRRPSLLGEGIQARNTTLKAREAHQLGDAELNDRLREAYQELFNLRIQKATRELSNTARIGQVRKDIARIKTILHERALSEAAIGAATKE